MQPWALCILDCDARLTVPILSLPVRWHEKSIIVMDNVLIEPPYGVNDCKAPPKNAKQLERVKELVKNEQEKSQKDNTLGRKGG